MYVLLTLTKLCVVDPRLEFIFQLLMDGTQLPRHQIMDHIFEGDMVNNDNHKFNKTIEIYAMKTKFCFFGVLRREF